MSEGGSWWAVVGWPAVAASVPGAIAIWQWWYSFKDKRDARAVTAAERQQAALLADRELISREHGDIYKRLEDELERAMAEKDRLRAQRRELERDRDAGWDLARWWHQRAHELRHIARDGHQVAQGLAERQGRTLPAWPDTTVVGLEDPLAMKEPPEGKA